MATFSAFKNRFSIAAVATASEDAGMLETLGQPQEAVTVGGLRPEELSVLLQLERSGVAHNALDGGRVR